MRSLVGPEHKPLPGRGVGGEVGERAESYLGIQPFSYRLWILKSKWLRRITVVQAGGKMRGRGSQSANHCEHELRSGGWI